MARPWRPRWFPDDEDARGGRDHPARSAAHSPDAAASLGDEVEAFVHGRSVDHLVAAGRSVPAWTVLNRLAHARVQELTELAADGGVASGESPPAEPAWLHAQRSLAAALVTGATTPEDIECFQRMVLVPLELWVIQRARSEAITSCRVIELASKALADHRPTA